MNWWSIDRFEGDMAICLGDDGSQIEILRASLPPGAKETDCLLKNGMGFFEIDEKETGRRKEHALELQRKLFGKTV